LLQREYDGECRVSVAPAALGTLTTAATVWLPKQIPQSGNNTVVKTIPVTAVADLALTKVDVPEPSDGCTAADLHAHLANHGPHRQLAWW